VEGETITLLDAASEYARMGWQVLACHPVGHQPLVKCGFYAANTELQINVDLAAAALAEIELQTAGYMCSRTFTQPDGSESRAIDMEMTR
jgi:hypothetical protein